MGRITFFSTGMPMGGMHIGSHFMHGMGCWNMPIFMMPQQMPCTPAVNSGVTYTFDGLKKVCKGIKYCWDNTMGKLFKWLGGLGKKRKV